MPRQATLGDSSPAFDHYDQHADLYDYIQGRLDATRQRFMQGDRGVKWQMLDKSATFAILSANTRVRFHEAGFVDLMGLTSPTEDEIADVLHENNIMYHNNKARYIYENRRDADRGAIISALEAGEIDKAHRLITEEYLGLSYMKAAFTLAMLGFDRKMCVDTNVAQNVGLEGKVGANLKNIGQYEDLCKEVREVYQDLNECVSNFIWQWATFSQFRGEVTTHDPFFLSVGIDL